MAVRVRPAAPADVEALHGLIVELARFHGSEADVTGTPAMLSRALFGDRPFAEALVAEVDRELAGIAVFHARFSTYECLPGLWLEDSTVRPFPRKRRRAGVADRAGATDRRARRPPPGVAPRRVERAGARFYEGLGAELVPDERLHRLSGAALHELAGPTDGRAALPPGAIWASHTFFCAHHRLPAARDDRRPPAENGEAPPERGFLVADL